ncbi:MAG: hypothetical protein ACRD1R_17190 [Acidobacteriota bacterium]
MTLVSRAVFMFVAPHPTKQGIDFLAGLAWALPPQPGIFCKDILFFDGSDVNIPAIRFGVFVKSCTNSLW